MPELPEVETVCRGLAKNLPGKRITAVEQRRKDLRTALPENLVERLIGHSVTSISRRAKYIQIFLDNDDVLLLHLGMSGRLLITPEAKTAEKHDHLVFHFDDDAVAVARSAEQSRNTHTCVRFNDPRRFGGCDLVKAADLPQHKWLQHLGIEPLNPALTPRWLREKFRGRTMNVKTALMDQRLVVGIGNIYAAEALFYAGISPKRLAGSCRPTQLAALVPAIQKVLKAAIKAGGSSLKDYRQTNGEFGYFQHNFAVYGRAGKACPGCTCDMAKTGGIQRITQAGRSSFYCTTRQV